MLQLLSQVTISDNSGALKGKVIKILGNKKIGKIGDLVIVSILKNQPNSKIRKGSIFTGIIIRTKIKTNNILWNDNSIILVKLNKTDIIPIGSRIKGPISSRLKTIPNTQKLLAIAKKTI